MTEKQKKFWFFKKNIIANLAKYAISQSPYLIPSNLEKVLTDLDKLLIPEFKDSIGSQSDPQRGMIEMSYYDIKDLLSKYFLLIPEITEWNETTPDFIDIDALNRNIANAIVRGPYEPSIPDILSGKLKSN